MGADEHDVRVAFVTADIENGQIPNFAIFIFLPNLKHYVTSKLVCQSIYHITLASKPHVNIS